MSARRHRGRANGVRAWVERFLDGGERAGLRARNTVASPADALQRMLAPWLARRSTVALFLDYDGTLTPIAPRPEDAQLSEVARQTLDQAARTPNLDIVIVSGRALADVQQRVGVPGLTYVGNHGFEIEGPGISFRHPELERWRAALEAAASELEALAASRGAIQRKGASGALHLRPVP